MVHSQRLLRKVPRVVAAGAAAAFACGMVLAVGVRPAVAESPPGCSQNFLNIGIGVPPADPQAVFNGSPVTYTVQLTNNGTGACDAENVNTTFCCPGPDGQPAPTSDALGLVPVTECAGSPPFEDCCVTLPEAASVPANGAAVDLPNVVCRDVFNPVPALPAQLFVRANSAGILRAGADPGVPNGATASKLFPITIVPCDVQIDKQCSVDGGATWHDVGYPDDGITDVCDTTFGSDILVRYLVNNSNLGAGLNLFSCGVTDSNGVILTGTLDAGDLLAGQEITLDPIQRVCDGTLTAEEPNTGTVECFCTQELDPRFTTTDSDQDNITCVPVPGVSISKTCGAEDNCVNPVSVTVTNTGDVGLTNCQITDHVYENNGGACTGTATRTLTPPSFDLAVGANNIVNLDLDLLPVGDTCDTAEVTCDAVSGGQVSDGPANAICTVVPPNCEISKTCGDQVGGSNAVDITLSNAGQTALSCDVVDTVYQGDDSEPCDTGTQQQILNSTGQPVAVGGNVPIQTNVSGLTATSCNNVTATCASATCAQRTDTCSDDALCPVCNPAVSITKTCDTQVDNANQMTITVTNTGDSPLSNCQVVDTLYRDDATCSTGSETVTLTPSGSFDLPVGGSPVVLTGEGIGLLDDSCNHVMVTCTPDCRPDDTVTDEDTATCTVPKGGCRVTGGGRIYSLYPDADCDPNTDDNCLIPAAQDATHGGQVGAPVGVATPFDPDSACIKGEWEHVRHIRPRLRGNFHASSFDSLMCGCLGCLGDDGKACDPALNQCPIDGLENGLCHPANPGQNFKENRICGPEPRKAPANKICFSGVGDYALTNGKRARRSVVFRVDIIDRSEPGGGFPGGSVDPPDRYRMRMWFLCDPNDPTAPCLDPASDDVMALREGVACLDPAVETLPDTVASPNIDDGGDLDRGNHQLHPPTGAECTALQ
jgi:hypothetical protein